MLRVLRDTPVAPTHRATLLASSRSPQPQQSPQRTPRAARTGWGGADPALQPRASPSPSAGGCPPSSPRSSPARTCPAGYRSSPRRRSSSPPPPAPSALWGPAAGPRLPAAAGGCSAGPGRRSGPRPRGTAAGRARRRQPWPRPRARIAPSGPAAPRASAGRPRRGGQAARGRAGRRAWRLGAPRPCARPRCRRPARRRKRSDPGPAPPPGGAPRNAPQHPALGPGPGGPRGGVAMATRGGAPLFPELQPPAGTARATAPQPIESRVVTALTNGARRGAGRWGHRDPDVHVVQSRATRGRPWKRRRGAARPDESPLGPSEG